MRTCCDDPLKPASTPRSWRLAVACAAAWASHVLLDWLGTDAMAPIGVMALWPVDSAHYLSSLHWFLPIHREFGELTTWLRDIRAVTRELLLLGPLAWAVIFLRRLGGQARRLR